MSTTEATLPHSPATGHRPASDYAALLTQVRLAGLLRRRPGYYAARITINTVLIAVGWSGFVLLGDSWWQLATAAYLAVVLTQIAFVGHDAGHRQIFRRHRSNDIAGILHANLAVGLSYDWWVDNHNRHHAHPNQEGKDPDIQIVALAFTVGQTTARGRLAGIAYRYQAVFFFPLLLLQAIALHVHSVRALLGRAGSHRGWERALLAANFVGYLAVVFVVLSPARAVAFIVVQQGLLGFYLGCAFAPNHKGMAMLGNDDGSDFLRRQVLTSRNVRGGWLVDIALGGLNYQIEHHLFPSMPAPSLRHARPLVRAYCLTHGLPYTETGLVDSYRHALRYLHGVGRGRPTPQSGPAEPKRIDGPAGPPMRR